MSKTLLIAGSDTEGPFTGEDFIPAVAKRTRSRFQGEILEHSRNSRHPWFSIFPCSRAPVLCSLFPDSRFAFPLSRPVLCYYSRTVRCQCHFLNVFDINENRTRDSAIQTHYNIILYGLCWYIVYLLPFMTFLTLNSSFCPNRCWKEYDFVSCWST